MTEPYKRQVFDFDDRPAESEMATANVAGGGASPLSAEEAMAAAGVVAYRWSIGTDTIDWSPNIGSVIGRPVDQIATGKSYAALLDPDSFTGRYDAVMRSGQVDNGGGVPFAIEYVLRSDSRSSSAGIWVEDHGRWFAGPDGRPQTVLGTVRAIRERSRRDQQLSFLGNCDPLTGMMNRGRLAEALGEAMSVTEREGTSCGLILVAINNLGVVNDAFGFEIADEVIVAVGRRLRQAVRAGDAIARYSGSKFGIILNHCDEEALDGAIKRFLDMARESVIETGKGPVWALLSIGGLVLPAQADDATAAMARAEEALSEARRLPSDGYVIYKPSPERDERREFNAQNASEIVRCLREDRFLLAYQPVVARDGGKPAYHEALLRIRNSAGNIVTAGDLIPIAEKLGLVRLIDRAVMQMAIATMHRHPEARLAINISGTTATDQRWSQQIIELLEANPAIAPRLVIEITETVALSDIGATRRFADSLRKLGCAVAIDDFGEGFTSFRSLRSLPVDVLKIDGHFCRDLARNADNQYFVRTLIDLARAFNLKTVAEWVENEADAALLREWHADYLQGNLFGAASLEPPWPRAEEADGGQAGSPDMRGDIDWLQPGEPSHSSLSEAGAAAPVKNSEAETPAIAAFESDLSQELSKLRQAIAALDASFRGDEAASGAKSEPSYADLVSDTAFVKAS